MDMLIDTDKQLRAALSKLAERLHAVLPPLPEHGVSPAECSPTRVRSPLKQIITEIDISVGSLNSLIAAIEL